MRGRFEGAHKSQTPVSQSISSESPCDGLWMTVQDVEKTSNEKSFPAGGEEEEVGGGRDI